MDPNHLTYQWLTPILLVIIGFMIKDYLNSIKNEIKEIKTDVKSHVDKVEKFIEKVYLLDKRVDYLEAAEHEGELAEIRELEAEIDEYLTKMMDAEDEQEFEMYRQMIKLNITLIKDLLRK